MTKRNETISSGRLRKLRGMTLFELLVVIAVIGILASIIAPNFLRLARRANIEGAAQVAIQHLSEARAEAITRGVDVIVHPDLRNGRHYLVAWADVDDDGVFDGTIAANGAYTAAAGTYKTVDYPLFEWQLPYESPGTEYKNIYFWAASESAPALTTVTCTDTDTDCGAMEGLTHQAGAAGWGDWQRGIVFEPEGSVEDQGAFRIAAGPHDGQRNRINFLELRIESAASGRVELRKYIAGLDEYKPKPVYDESATNYTPPYEWRWH